MNFKTGRKAFILFLILAVPSILYLLLTTGENKFEKVPYFGPREAIQAENDEIADTLYHTIADFSFINQLGDTINRQRISEKICVVDFFFTTCPGICPKMSMQLARIQHKYDKFPQVLILSHTVNPENDSVAILSDYANEYNANPERWWFLTGVKKEIYEMARNSYFITAMDGDGGEDDFIHSEKFVLIDNFGHIRGYYDGTSSDDVDILMEDIKALVLEFGSQKKGEKG